MRPSTYTRLLVLLSFAGFFMGGASTAQAGLVSFSTVPLTNSTTSIVKPNLLFILDDSGSMAWDYVPDWAGGYIGDVHAFSIPQGKNAKFNAMAYDPAVRYNPPIMYNTSGVLDTSTYPSQTSAVTSAWTSVKTDIYEGLNSTTNLATASPRYYTYIPGEYCTDSMLTTCINSASPSGLYVVPVYLRWCTTMDRTNCRDLYASGTYNFPEWPGMRATAKIVFSGGAGNSRKISSLLVRISAVDKQILSGTPSNGQNATEVAQNAALKINDCTEAITGSCDVAGFSATSDGTTLYIFSPQAPNATLTSATNTITPTYSNIAGAITGFNGKSTVGSATRVNITGAYSATAGAKRTDCGVDVVCTYAEEMENYANWYVYYRIRLNTMKTVVSRAFSTLDNNYRLGFTTINNSTVTSTVGSLNWGTRQFLPHGTFENTHKNNWYKMLFKSYASGSTPLPTSLSRAGRLYGYKLTGAADPMQYACQKNYTLLSTDGYWSNGSATADLNGTAVGNRDSSPTAPPKYEGATARTDSLADVAMYYFKTDIRNNDATAGPTFNNCGAGVCGLAATGDLKQNMITYTMGMGIDGSMRYRTDYKTATTGDYYHLTNAPVIVWGDPINSAEGKIDDLWHAAVNGEGLYFSAKDPEAMAAGFDAALLEIASKLGAGSAAASSTLSPVPGDNTIYSASFTTQYWTGNLLASSINLTTGASSATPSLCLETVKDANGAVICTGSMPSMVSATSDTRSIYRAPSSGTTLIPFTWGNLTSSEQLTFNSAALSQYGLLSSQQQTNAVVGTNYIAYLRGQTGNEMGRSANQTDDQVYRNRTATIGDIVNSGPVYVTKPVFSYSDPGYTAYVGASLSNANPTVYFGANDGMVHAINATTFQERWAFVPTPVIPQMASLASDNYDNNHKFLVNGQAISGDVFDGNAWRTIIVGGLAAGGRGYYALDITDPNAPKYLWELDASDFSAATNQSPGYGYGRPVITKLTNGTWVVLMTSGYNNVSPGDGHGYLYVVNAITGALIRTIDTGVGSVATPSGFAHIAAWGDDGERNNTSLSVYGGDLLGNVWRIDPNTGALFKFAVLKSPNTQAQPITTEPSLGLIEGKRVVFVGTGKYLESADLSDTQVQTIYAIEDDGLNVTYVNPRIGTNMKVRSLQTVVNNGNTERTTVTNPVPVSVVWSPTTVVGPIGWFIDFPDSKERVNINPQLEGGTIFVPTTVPDAGTCSPGGYSWFNYYDYRTGLASSGSGGIVGQRVSAVIVGFTILHLPNGQRVATFSTADQPTSQVTSRPIGGGGNNGGVSQTRVMWREIVR